MSAEHGELRIKPVRISDQANADWLKELYDLFAPVRAQTSECSEQEVNDAIDEAVHAVRKTHE